MLRNVNIEVVQAWAIFEFGRGFYGNMYISVLSALTLTPTVRMPLHDYCTAHAWKLYYSSDFYTL